MVWPSRAIYTAEIRFLSPGCLCGKRKTRRIVSGKVGGSRKKNAERGKKRGNKQNGGWGGGGEGGMDAETLETYEEDDRCSMQSCSIIVA